MDPANQCNECRSIEDNVTELLKRYCFNVWHSLPIVIIDLGMKEILADNKRFTLKSLGYDRLLKLEKSFVHEQENWHKIGLTVASKVTQIRLGGLQL